ncbi:hypothetical protein [Paenibacillus polymyxa]|uniref:hypothetical protein n=1 Tax=Paenibacillus polymyxa TaxID=1406 RepID=UPI002ED5D038
MGQYVYIYHHPAVVQYALSFTSDQLTLADLLFFLLSGNLHENGAGGMVLDKQQRWETPSACVVASM